MKIAPMAVLCLLAFTGMASARIGETESQLKKRYGDPLLDAEQKIYFFKKLLITVDFFEGKSVSEAFKKESDEEFTGGEVKAILQANRDETWRRSGGKDSTKWLPEAGDLVAFFDSEKTTVVLVTTQAELKRSQIEKDKKAQESLQGL